RPEPGTGGGQDRSGKTPSPLDNVVRSEPPDGDLKVEVTMREARPAHPQSCHDPRLQGGRYRFAVGVRLKPLSHEDKQRSGYFQKCCVALLPLLRSVLGSSLLAYHHTSGFAVIIDMVACSA